MKKKKIIEQSKPTSGVLYLEPGMSLADLINQALLVGATDFTKIRFDHDYVGCNADHGDGYCYCPSSYTDERFNWEI